MAVEVSSLSHRVAARRWVYVYCYPNSWFFSPHCSIDTVIIGLLVCGGSVLKYSPHKSVGQMFPKQIFFLSQIFCTIHKIWPEIQNRLFCCLQRQEQNVNQMQKHKLIHFFPLNSNVSVWQTRVFICQDVTLFLKKAQQQQNTPPPNKQINKTNIPITHFFAFN